MAKWSKQDDEELATAGREGAEAAVGAFDRFAAQIRDHAERLRLVDWREPTDDEAEKRRREAWDVFRQHAEMEIWLPSVEVRAAKPKRSTLTKRESRILLVAQRGLKGMAYCRELENDFIRPRAEWIERGCPKTYPAAYLDPHWRQMVQDEKAKVMRKASELPKVVRGFVH